MRRHLLFLLLGGYSICAVAEVLSSATSERTFVDTTVATKDVTSVRYQMKMPFAYSDVCWGDGRTATGLAKIKVDGEIISEMSGEGVYEWPISRAGVYVFSHEANGVVIKKTVRVVAPEVAIKREGECQCKLISSDGESEIRYTTDGSEPTKESKLYTGPFEVSLLNLSFVRACTFGDGYPQGVTVLGVFGKSGYAVSSSASTLSMDTRAGKGVVPIDGAADIAWSGLWEGDSTAEVLVEEEGRSILRAAGEGVESYYPLSVGSHILTHTTYKNGRAVGDPLTATLEMSSMLKRGLVSEGLAIIPQGTAEIGEGAFAGQGDLTSVTIPSSVSNVAATAFAGCSNIESVEFDTWPEMLHECKPEMSGWSAMGDNVYQTERQSKYDQTLVLKAEVEGPKKTSFRWKATYSGNYLRYYIDGVQQSYLRYASADWQEVQVNVPAGRHEIKWEYATSYSYGDYYGWVDLSGWSYYALAEVSRLFPDSYANIQQVSIRNGVTKIGADAFLGCENLKRVGAESLDGWLGIEFANDAANPLNCGADLYVNGVKQVCTISFDAACEIEAPSALVRKPGLAYGELPKLSRAGWMFLGWFTAATGGEQVTFETKANASRTLYAHWLGVSDVEVFSGWPWQEVVIGYTITGETDDPVSLKVMATDNASGKTYACKTLEGVDFAPGRHVIKWNASADGVKFKSDDVVFTVRIVPQPPLYCVIDLSDGFSATGYPVTGLNAVPREGWTDEYKTTKLVLRRIDAGTFKMQNQYDVTLSRPFYMGVFEVTQKQYELVTGGSPSSYKGEMRPVEYVSYNMIRGSSEGAKWPETNSVDATSFLGKLRARTNLDFDLPTEAQWEYACRAGTTSDFNNGGSFENDLKQVGRYYNNRSDGKGGCTDAHTVVGSYQPNAWGLYDMHGNVWEWCLDWHGYGSVGAITDPKGVDWGSNRERRGGSWYSSSYNCTSSYRSGYYPSSSDYDGGFRLAWPLQDGDSTGDAEVSEASSASVPVDTTFVEGTNLEAVLSVAYGSVAASGCRIMANGAEIVNSTASGVKEWSPSAWGEYRMTYVGGVTIESTVVMEAEKVRDPVIAPPDGTIFETSCCTVSVTCATAGATIYFTKNGTTPRAKPAFLYTGPFEITDTATIVALAVKDGQQSEYVEATITRASLGPLTLASALGEPKLCDIATGGDGEWVPVEDEEGKERKTSALSGVLEEDDEGTAQVSWLEAKAYGKGTLTFWWRTSCEADPRGVYTCDYAEFKADGIVVAYLDGITDGWVPVTATFDTVGEHVLRWSYNADGWLAMEGEYEDCAWVNGVVWTPSAAPVVGPTVEGDEGATVTGDAEMGFVIKPSEGKTAVEVSIPGGIDAGQVTVEVSTKVASVKPNGAKVKIVSGGADITEFLNVPAADGNGIVDLTKAAVKEAIVKEAMDVEKGAEIKLDAADPKLKTPKTRVGLFYQLREGVTLDGMANGDSTIGDGNPWMPEIKVKGGNSAFYSIGVGKGE